MTSFRDAPSSSDAGLTFRDEVLAMLEGGGKIFETARELTRLLHETSSRGAVIGGVSVVLHGHLRTTRDVALFLPDGDRGRFVDVLKADGFAHDPIAREFVRESIPVHLVSLDQIRKEPRTLVDLEGIRTVSLADLIGMKLRSGTANLLRAQDLADVIGLARCHRLTGEFARKLDKDERPAFRKIVRAIVGERDNTS